MQSFDLRAAHARVVAPPQGGIPGDVFDAAAPKITHVPNAKLPHPLGSPPFVTGKFVANEQGPSMAREAPVGAPKVCASVEQQPQADAWKYGHVALGPPTYSFASRQRNSYYNPPPTLLMRLTNEERIRQVGALLAVVAGLATALYYGAPALYYGAQMSL